MNAQPPTGASVEEENENLWENFWGDEKSHTLASWLPMSDLQDDQPPSSLPMSVLQDSLGHLSGENEGFSCVDYYLSDPSDASVDADEPVPSSLPMSVLQPDQPPRFDASSQDSEAIIQPSQNNAGISETLGFFNGMS